eukprot:1766684-Lingulodinium_polyedra.AAC.1
MGGVEPRACAQRAWPLRHPRYPDCVAVPPPRRWSSTARRRAARAARQSYPRAPATGGPRAA